MPRPVPALLCAALATLAAGCATPSSDAAGSARTAQAARTAGPSPTPDCEPAPLARRAAAVLVVGMPGVTTAEDALGQQLVDMGVSGLFLNHANVQSGEQVEALLDGLRARAGRPILMSTDEEGGRVAVTRTIVGKRPSPRRQAQQRTPAQVRELAAEMGGALVDVGVDWDLAPLLDLDDGPPGGIIGDRSYSGDPETATEYGLAFSAGLQDAGVVPTVKHFPGHGRSDKDTHAESEVVTASLDELRETDLLPFQRAIDAGIPAIMLNHLQYAELDPDLPATMSPRAYALLREMGFEGVAITDSVGMGPVNLRWDFPEAAVRAIEAGADAVLATQGDRAGVMRDAIVQAVQSGRLPEDRLSEAAARTTALVGGDPVAMSCLDVELPQLRVAAAATATPAARQ